MSLHTHPEWQDLLAGICAYPDDDLRRLVAADWLTEHGEEERAEFVRVQTQGGDTTALTPDLGDWLGSLPPGTAYTTREYALTLTAPAVLVRRGFADVVRAPLAWLIGGQCERCEGRGYLYAHNPGNVGCESCGGKNATMAGEPGRQFFIESGTGRTPARLDELVRCQPVTKVVVVDREPKPNTAEEGAVEWWGWYVVGELMEQEGYDLPTELWPQLRHHRTSLAWDRDRPSRWCQFPTREDALDALSDALLNPARERAGLPALHPAEPLEVAR
jgi:uncharacterized protein (TIGR02996 family)